MFLLIVFIVISILIEQILFEFHMVFDIDIEIGSPRLFVRRFSLFPGFVGCTISISGLGYRLYPVRHAYFVLETT